MGASRDKTALLALGLATVVLLTWFGAPAIAVPLAPSLPQAPDSREKIIPLMDWATTPVLLAPAAQERAKGVQTKADADPVSVYRPVTPCRLVDTRGNGAPIQGGAISPNTRRTISAAGLCGLPVGTSTYKTRGYSLSFHIFNYTVNNGGYVSFIAPGAPASVVNLVLNTGAVWAGATSNVPTDTTGNFDVYVANSQIDLIVDVNGYYEDLDQVRSTTEVTVEYTGASGGALTGLASNSGGAANGVQGVASGSGAGVSASSATGPALNISQGYLKVQGAGFGTNTTVTQHQVNTAGYFGAGGTLCGGTFPYYSVIDNVYANGDPNAILIVTPLDWTSGGPLTPNIQFSAYYFSGGICVAAATNHWMIHKTDNTAFANGQRFNILIVKP